MRTHETDVLLKKLLSVVLLSALLGSACSGSGDDPLGAMQVRRTSEEGTLTVTRSGDSFEVGDITDLEIGDRLAASDGATAILRLAGEGQTVSLTSDDGTDTEIEVIAEDAVSATSGSVLVRAPQPTTVSFGDAEATSKSGVFRIDRLTSVTRVGSYEGSTAVTSPGEGREMLGTLWQLSVAAGDLSRPLPYQLDATDDWDADLLKDVVELDRDLN